MCFSSNVLPGRVCQLPSSEQDSSRLQALRKGVSSETDDDDHECICIFKYFVTFGYIWYSNSKQYDQLQPAVYLSVYQRSVLYMTAGAD